MLARLWWKEWRAFGPVWLILLLAAAGVQWMDLAMQGDFARNGSLTPLALFWGVIYAFAAGSAAFAGERDARTMGFLEALPIGRLKLWLAKAVFALVSTFGLSILLAILAALGTTRRDPAGSYGYAEMAQVFGTLLFEGVAWGLFWSSLSKNPLPGGGDGGRQCLRLGHGLLATVRPNRILASNDLVCTGGLFPGESWWRWRPCRSRPWA